MLKFILIVIYLHCIPTLDATTLEVLTTEFPPYQTLENGVIAGKNTEIVNHILKQTKYNAKFSMYPWPRAYEKSLTDNDTLIYSIARTPEREKLFHWITPISSFNVYLWKLSKNKQMKIKTLDDAKRYTIGGVLNDVKANYLLKMGFIVDKNLEYASNDELNLRKFYAGRIDIMIADEVDFLTRSKRHGFDSSSATRLIKIDGISNQLYLAASLKTSPEIVLDLIKASKSVKKSHFP
jgi:polar amino acid transport system substrate-binding protein